MMLQTGIKGKQTITVNHAQTAAFYGSGALEVFATPAMIALLEETAWKSVQPFLDAGLGTVGTRVDVRHLAATPLGMEAACAMAAGCGGTASDELVRLVVLNTASIQLLPTTAASLRAALGAAAPFDITPAVWLSSALSVSAGLGAAALLRRIWPA